MEVGIENMTLRDYFAAKAMTAIYANCEGRTPVTVAMDPEQWIATQAYMMADAMIQARAE